jgi:hypothetical protein
VKMPSQRCDCAQITGMDADGTIYGFNIITWHIDASKLKRQVKIGDWVEIGGRRDGTLIAKRIVKELQF